MLTVPEDSVLRRHYLGAIRRGQSVPGMPQDSTLRRHAASALGIKPPPRATPTAGVVNAETKTMPEPAARQASATVAPRTTTRTESASTVPRASAAPLGHAPRERAASGGLLGWLRRLFGG